VHIGAVGQVHDLPVAVPEAHQLPPRRIELPSKVAGGSMSARSSRPDRP
jgi:hypothetical protein